MKKAFKSDELSFHFRKSGAEMKRVCDELIIETGIPFLI